MAMNPDELLQIRKREKGQKCFVKSCEECFHWRDWPAVDKGGRPIGIKKACSIETLAVTLRSIGGYVTGLQGAVEESRNQAMATRNSVDKFGRAATRALVSLARKVPRLFIR